MSLTDMSMLQYMSLTDMSMFKMSLTDMSMLQYVINRHVNVTKCH